MKRLFKTSLFIFVALVITVFTAFSALAGLLGDVDASGKLTAADARLVLRASVGLEEFTDIQNEYADVNRDGKITAADARLVLRASVGLEELGETGHEHIYSEEVILEPTCTKEGQKKITCSECSYSVVEFIPKLGHDMGEWVTVVDSTVEEKGYERSTCKRCTYYNDRDIPLKEVKYRITCYDGTGNFVVKGVAEDGKYSLTAPKRVGYVFTGWKDSLGNDFPSEGVISADIAVDAQFTLDITTTEAQLRERTAEGTDYILIGADIMVTGPIYVPFETTIYSDGDFSIIRDPQYAGDIFVVGSDKNGNKSVDKNIKAILNLGGGVGTLSVDGNRDNITVDVNGTLVFVADSSEFNLYDGAVLKNNLKTENERIKKYSVLFNEDNIQRVGGAGLINISSEVNIYGGSIENNQVATEYTVIDNGDGTATNFEKNACGGGVYTRGTLNMYAGKITSNNALRGGGVYNDKFCYFNSGEISFNRAEKLGGGVSSSSSSNANIFVGSLEETEEAMVLRENTSGSSGAGIYSNTSSPIRVYKNAQFISNHSESSGGAIYTAGPLVITGATFTDNSCEYSGGAIYHHYTKADFGRRYLELSDCLFEGNEGGLGGAVILSATGSVTDEGTYANIKNCTFTGNNAVTTLSSQGNAGAIYITRDSDADIAGCTFTNNTAVNNAGAVSVQSGATMDITDCEFTENSAASGGAVSIGSDANVTMENISFEENLAHKKEDLSSGNGGAVYYAQSTLTMKNVKFIGNTAENNAGAVYMNSATLHLDDTCEFDGNTAGNHGGALYLTYKTLEDGTREGSVLTAKDGAFKNNSALAGGAISARSESDISFTNVKFTNNNTKDAEVGETTGGGAIYANNSKATFNNCLFEENYSGYYGGALRFDSVETVMNDTTLNKNSGGTGGAVYSSLGSFTSSNLTVTENTSTLNGILYIAGNTAEIRNLNATGNKGVQGGVINAGRGADIKLYDSFFTANTAKNGGALFIAGLSKITSYNCQFDSNIADGGQGGAVYLNGADFDAFDGTLFNKNTATGHGGALSSQDNVDEATSEKTISHVNLLNCSFTENQGSSGGAVYLNDTEYAISECTFTKNTATNEDYGGGAVYNTGTTGKISAATFTENSAKRGGAVALYSNSNVIFSGITASGNTALAEGGAIYVNKSFADLSGEGFTFTANSAKNGGALFATRANEININEGTYEENSATDNGGAIYAAGTVVNIKGEKTSISRNKAGGYGGAVYISYVTEEDNTKTGGILNIDGVSLTDNTALYGGAVAGRTDSKLNFRNLTLSGNTTPEATSENKAGGGAVYVNNSEVSFENVNIKGNSSGYYGGAVLASASDITVGKNIVIEENEGGTGAVMHLSGESTLTMAEGTVLRNNTARVNGIIYGNNSEITLTSIEATENKAINGGVIYVSGNSVANINYGTFVKNSVSGKGGIVFSDSSEVYLTNVTASENTAKTGGVLYAELSDIYVTDSTLTKNTASGGGAVYVENESTLTLTGVAFTENTASSNGGAVYVKLSELTLTDTSLTKNTAGVHGGAIYLTGSRATASGNNSFTENEAGNHGGAIYVVYTDVEKEGGAEERIPSILTMTNGSFEGNSALGGGAVSIRTKCEAVFTDTVFENNTVSGYADDPDGDGEGGGAVYVGFGSLTMENVTATGNKAIEGINTEDNSVAPSFGGAVNAYYANDVIITGGEYKNNTASAGGAFNTKSGNSFTVKNALVEENESVFVNKSYDNNFGGGAVKVTGGALTISGTVLRNNKTSYYGGAVLASDAEVTINDNTSIENNEGGTGAAILLKAGSTLNMTGAVLKDNISTANGVIYGNNSILNIDGLVATNNISKNGGVIYVSNQNTVVTIKNSAISENEASASGAVIYSEAATINLENTSFNENSAKNGGVVYAETGSVNVTGSTFLENMASGNGGALNIQRATLTIHASSFTGNTAGNHGGAIFNGGSVTTLTGENSFIENKADNHGGAIYVVYIDVEKEDKTEERVFSTLTMTDGTFSSNTALGGGAVSIRTGCEATFNNTVFENNSVSGYQNKPDGNGEGGGAVYVGFGTLNLNNITATNNTANEGVNTEDNSTAFSFGGAVDALDSVVNVTDGTFTGNKATSGGAVSLLNGSVLTMNGTSLQGNESTGNSGENLSSDFGGGAIFADSSEASLSNVIFDGNKTNYYGGAVHSIESDITIDKGSEIKNTSGSTGAAVYLKAESELTLNNISVTDNISDVNGVIYLNNSVITAENVTATGNESAYGGVLYLSANAQGTLTGGEWKNNSAKAGGAIYVNNAKLSLDGVNFSDNTANLGGAIYNSLGDITSVDTVFTNNSAVKTEGGASGNGGAVSVVGGTFTGTGDNRFLENSAEYHGGAVYVSYVTNDDETRTGGVFTLTDGLLEGNEADIGGAISARTACVTSLTGTTLKGNTALSEDGDGGAGAIYVNDNTLNLSGVSVTGNSTGYYGGAITANNAEVNITDGAVFTGNVGKTGAVMNFRGKSIVTMNNVTVSDNINTKGNGNIYMTGTGTLDITGLTATDNTNTNGGVFYFSSACEVTIKDSLFSGNSASGLGGVIDFRGSKSLTVEGSVFSDNTAENGGVINAQGAGTTDIRDCVFEENSATEQGGALYITGSGPVTVSDNSEFNKNTSPKGGAVVVDNGAKATINNSEFNENSASSGDGGAILVADSSEDGNLATTLNLNTVTFTGNTADLKGGAISTDTNSPKLVINAVSCVFSGNEAVTAGGGAVEIQNGNSSSSDPEDITIVFTSCTFTENTAKTTGAAIEIRTSSLAKFDSVTATKNTTTSNGAVFYVTSNNSRLYLTGEVTLSENSAKSGNFAYLYNNKYSNPPRIYTTHSSTATWVSDVKGNSSSITFEAVMP